MLCKVGMLHTINDSIIGAKNQVLYILFQFVTVYSSGAKLQLYILHKGINCVLHHGLESLCHLCSMNFKITDYDLVQ